MAFRKYEIVICCQDSISVDIWIHEFVMHLLLYHWIHSCTYLFSEKFVVSKFRWGRFLCKVSHLSLKWFKLILNFESDNIFITEGLIKKGFITVRLINMFWKRKTQTCLYRMNMKSKFSKLVSKIIWSIWKLFIGTFVSLVHIVNETYP